MLPSDDHPVRFRDELPASVDVVIVGGGVIGVSTAWFLARRGVDVLVLEKGRVAGEQSSRNWGWIRKQGRDEDELPIAMESQEIWAGLGAEIGEDVGFARRGIAYLADTEEQLSRHAGWLDVAERHQLDTRLLTGKEVDALIQGPPGRYAGALYTPSDARAEPFVAVPALARAVRRAGGRIVENCAVRGIEFQGGAVSAVVAETAPVRTNRGRVRCRCLEFVVAAAPRSGPTPVDRAGHRRADGPGTGFSTTAPPPRPVSAFVGGRTEATPSHPPAATSTSWGLTPFGTATDT